MSKKPKVISISIDGVSPFDTNGESIDVSLNQRNLSEFVSLLSSARWIGYKLYHYDDGNCADSDDQVDLEFKDIEFLEQDGRLYFQVGENYNG